MGAKKARRVHQVTKGRDYGKLHRYQSRAGVVLGFHGCDANLQNMLLTEAAGLGQSNNDYDWLGPGIYFWENDPTRALLFAQEKAKRKGSSIKNPACVGAVIEYGKCLDLLDYNNLQIVKLGFDILKKEFDSTNIPLPENKTVNGSFDLLLRHLDCAVLKRTVQFAENELGIVYDTVRGVFWEGNELYPNSGFREKNHVQLCVRNPAAIKGYFAPLEEVSG